MRLPFCCACGTDDRSVLEHHHLVPRSEGGADDAVNLITLCSSCHGKVHGTIRKDISKLTKAGLARAKARGVKLGNPNGARCLRGIGNGAAVEKVKADAAERAERLRPIIEDIQGGGDISLRGIAGELNQRGILTARGGRWHASTVRQLLGRLA